LRNLIAVCTSPRLAASITLASALAIPTSRAEPAEPYEKLADKAVLKVRAFEPADVRLLEGPFKKAFDDNTGFLLRVEPDRLLHRFLAYNGLAPKGELYGGWEAEGLSGHGLGHYLSACALAYASSGDQRLLDRVTYIVDELARAQDARGDGYVGGIPNQDALFRDIETGNFFNVRQNYINNFWAPWYTIHKIFAGLLDAHRCCRSEKALRVADRYGRWAARITRNLDDAAWQKMLYAEFGGMSESLAELYARTGDESFMGLSRHFYHRDVLEPLAAGQDKLDGFHANCQIPKVIGAARDYEVTADERGRRIAAFFWDTVTKNHTYANGGNSEAEYFGPPGVLSTRLTEDTSETCNTYNMLKLTRHLFTWEPKVGYADYCERALFNHILASTEPGTGMKCYYMPLTGKPKEYSTPFDSFWCCVGTGWENPARYTDSIYFHEAGTLYVNLFIASRLDWKEKAITVTQDTRFPEEDVTRLRIGGKGARFALKVRHPFWATGPLAVKLNGQPIRETAKAGEYFVLDRDWKSGDVLEVRLPMALRIEATPDDPHKISLFHGPVLLAADLGPEGKPSAPMPVLVAGDKPLTQSIEPSSPEGPLHFRTVGLGRPQDVLLKPYYMSHHSYGPVYFDRLSASEWETREVERKAMEARTLDRLVAGDEAAAAAHGLDIAKAPLGLVLGRPAWELGKDAYGYVRFELDSKGIAKPLALSLSLWSGTEGGFDVIANGTRIGQTDLKKDKPLRVKQLSYAVPESLTRRPGKLAVWIVPQPNKPGPAVFGAALLEQP
jgi:DUF1680 family protein